MPSDISLSGSDYMSFVVPEIYGDKETAASTWQEVHRTGVCIYCGKEQIIDTAGKYAADLFYVEKGRVRLIFHTADGRQRTLMIFHEGAVFNLTCALLNRNASGQFQCAVDSTIWRVPGETLRNPYFISSYPVLTGAALKQLSNITLIYSTWLTDMLLDDFTPRFCRYILSLHSVEQSLDFPLGITQEQCATTLGVHLATLGRAVQQLKKEGIIEKFTKNHVTILDLERLKRLAG